MTRHFAVFFATLFVAIAVVSLLLGVHTAYAQWSSPMQSAPPQQTPYLAPKPASRPQQTPSWAPQPAAQPTAAQRSAAPAQTQTFVPLELESKSKSWAVLVGVNEYIKLAKLSYCVDDITAIESSLLQTGFDKDCVFCLTSGSGEKDLPTRSNIVQVLELVTQSAGEDDFVFVALNGHGIEIQGVQYFCPSDTDDREERIQDTTISIDWIYKTLDESAAKFKLVMVDACRDNPFKGRRSALVNEMRESPNPPPGIVLVRSCGPNETSLEDEVFKRGIFTHYFLEGLTGTADQNGDGIISFLELYMYTQGKTQSYAIRAHRSKQTPYLKGEVSDFPFAKNYHTQSRPATQQQQPQQQQQQLAPTQNTARSVDPTRGVQAPPSRSGGSPVVDGIKRGAGEAIGRAIFGGR